MPRGRGSGSNWTLPPVRPTDYARAPFNFSGNNLPSADPRVFIIHSGYKFKGREVARLHAVLSRSSLARPGFFSSVARASVELFCRYLRGFTASNRETAHVCVCLSVFRTVSCMTDGLGRGRAATDCRMMDMPCDEMSYFSALRYTAAGAAGVRLISQTGSQVPTFCF